ncbi:MAG: alpha/beta hydrolase [Mycobacterium sp.]
MPDIQIGDLSIAYEVHGSGPSVAITPGGRFGVDEGGVRELAMALAERGFRVLIWDRPNCGRSSVAFRGESESALWADTLAELIRSLDFGPAALVGGSAGSRVSLMTAARHPDVAGALYLWWISGGTYGLMSLGVHYVGDSLLAAQRFGMDRVARLRTWRASIEANPANRERILATDRDRFIDTMHSWIDHYLPSADSPVPGMSVNDFAALRIPVSILRSGSTDLHHPRPTSEWVHRLVPDSRLAEPPWGDDEWNERGDASLKGASLFERWPLLAPDIAGFLGSHAQVRMEGNLI